MTIIIAEAGVNHNGDLGLALELVDAAAAAGADVFKIQTFRADALASAVAPKAAYQARQTGETETQLEMLRRLEFSAENHEAVIARCAERGIAFLSTPFDFESLKLLTGRFGLKRIKFGSGELTNAPLLLEGARAGVELILSTGMATLDEVEQALGVVAFGMTAPASTKPSRAAFAEALRSADAWTLLRERLTLLHCTTDYPAAVADVNLRAMDTLREAFGIPVGYSDHTEGMAVSVAAVARAAVLIEKHITLDRSMAGPDHLASADPDQFKAMVDAIREVERALGSPIKQPGASESANRVVARKSLVAARAVRAGEAWTPESLTVMRPGSGREPAAWWETLGAAAERDYAAGEPLDP